MNNNINIIEFEKDIMVNIDQILQYENIKKYFHDENKVIEIQKREYASDIIDKLIVGKNICIYGILIKNKEIGSKWELKYIGVRKSREIKQRLKQHFVNKSDQTNSQLARISKLDGKAILGLKLANIADIKLRNYYEEKLIEDFKPGWNSHGNKK